MKLTKSIFILAIILVSCKKDTRPLENPPQPTGEEVITSVVLQLTDSAGVLAPMSFAFRDTDGPGGSAPVEWDTLVFPANTTWYGNVLLLNESVSPADTISNEVLTEATEHLICYPVIGWNGTIVRTDSDGTYELGLQTKWKSNAISNGNVTVILKHQPGIKNGTCNVGETDVEVVFQTRTQ